MSLLQKVFLCWPIHKTVSTYKVYKENILNVGNMVIPKLVSQTTQ